MRKSLILNENYRGHEIVISVMTEEEEIILDSLLVEYNSKNPHDRDVAAIAGRIMFKVDIGTIISYGLIDESSRLTRYVPKTTYVRGGHGDPKNLLFPSGVTAYKCYARLYDHATFLGKRQGRSITGIAIHEDSKSSINCLMDVLGNPARAFLSVSKIKDNNDDKK